MEKTILSFCLIVACFSSGLGANSEARPADFDYSPSVPVPYSINSNQSHLLVYNKDGTVRGGAYSLDPFAKVYAVSLHTLQNSWFFEVYKKDFNFYGFKIPYDKQAESEVGKDYRWVDMVILVSRIEHPKGLNEPLVRSLLNTLIGRELNLDYFSALAGVESIVPIPGNLTKYMLRENWGDIKKGRRGLIFEIPNKISTITPGSSGALVYANSTDVVGALSGPSEIYTDKIPIGILKCLDLRFPQRDGVDRYELESFDTIFELDTWVIRLKAIPDVKYDPNCINVNARGHGGL